jgi:hypothetical protein
MMRPRLLLLLLALAPAGCASQVTPACSFQCGDFNNFACPQDYTCNKDDGYCHYLGMAGSCPPGYGFDAAPMKSDGGAKGDGGSADMAGASAPTDAGAPNG